MRTAREGFGLARLLVLISVAVHTCLLTGAASAQAPSPSAGSPPAASSKPTLFLIGDSTVRNGRADGAGELWGWGDLIAPYFDVERINVTNRARGGRSSRTYLAEGLWDEVRAERVAFVDLNELIARRYEQFGAEAVSALFKEDHTHTNAPGAELNAACVVAGLKGLADCPLCAFLSSKGRELTACEVPRHGTDRR